MKSLCALILWSLTSAAFAQAPFGPHHPPGPPSPEALATIPNLTPAQQIELRRILLDERDAHEAIASKARAEREARAKKDRGEHERVDEQGAERLRKLLGDDGFRQFAEWQFAHRGGPGHAPGEGPGPDANRRGAHRPGADKVALGGDGEQLPGEGAAGPTAP
jgi:hypothetical protein